MPPLARCERLRLHYYFSIDSDFVDPEHGRCARVLRADQNLEQMYIIFFVPPYALNTEQPDTYSFIFSL